METKSEAVPNSQPLSWPAWLQAAGQEIVTHLDKIHSCKERFRSAVHNGHTYEYVFQRQITSITDQLVTEGIVDPKTGELKKKNIEVSRKVALPMLYQNGSASRLLSVMCVAKQIVLVHLLDSTIASLFKGNFLVGLICLRSVIEHVSHFDALLAQLRRYSVPAEVDELNRTLWQINSVLVKSTFATRIDWTVLAAGKNKTDLERAKIKYKPGENREDLSAKQILDAVDGLGKHVKGIRAVYEVLCEFAHPNVGSSLGITRSAKPLVDKEGVGWVRKELSLEPPIGLIEEMGSAYSQIFGKIAECLSYFENLLLDADTQRNKIRQITQTNLRYCLLRQRDIISLYAPCPCGSGAKVKFCCGSTKDI